MRFHPATAQRQNPLTLTLALLALTWLGGCAAVPRMPVQARQCRIDANLDPGTHEIRVHAALDLVRTGEAPTDAEHQVAVEFELHPDLVVSDLWAAGAEVVRQYARPSQPVGAADLPAGHPPPPPSTTHVVVLAAPVDSLTLFVEYGGTLFQDVAAGEKIGQVHNFDMRAHIGEDGIYLAGGPWYPAPVCPEDAAPALADYQLLVTPIEGFALQACALRDQLTSERTGRWAWRSPYPLDGMALVGGPHVVHEETYKGRTISVHLLPEQARHAEGLIATVKRVWDRYEPLIGPYPASEYAIVDNFFSSGFAYPTFTLLSSPVINMGRRSQMRHGMIDHEMLHCWWGNGIFVDPRYGNWCESITTYAANYYGYILDGDEEGARRIRRNYCHFLSRSKPEKEKPLGTFGLPGGCSRGVAYDKGAMVFQMLARKIGQENFWQAMRLFTERYLGKFATWDDIQRLCEETGGQPLDAFFEQWVQQAGAPELNVVHPVYDPTKKTLTFTLTQGEHGFDLDVPVRITHADGELNLTIRLSEATQEVTLGVEVLAETVEADPDYEVYRRVPLRDVFPTSAATRRGEAFASVLPGGTCPEEYEKIRDNFAESFEEDERLDLYAGTADVDGLVDRCTLILGDAVHEPKIKAFLEGIDFPVQWTAEGFVFDGTAHTDEGDGVLCTVSHPAVEGGGITVVYANSEEAIPKAFLIPHYPYSIVIFKNGMASLRQDFEKHHKVSVKVIGTDG